MTQNPLDKLRRRPAVVKRTFPNDFYEAEILEPVRSRLDDLLTARAIEVHRARIVGLVEIRTIERPQAQRALQALAADIPDGTGGQQPLDALEQVLSGTAEGQALLATAPEEVEATAMRLVLRDDLLGLVDAITGLRQDINQLALGHLTTSITATSNGQMVQPTTLGHYFVGYAGPLERATNRLQETWHRLNRSPLGAVSGMATAIPVRRERPAELLGFDGPVAHTFDALASADVEVELVSIVSGMALELSRMVADLSQWARDDTGTIVPSEEFVHGGGAQPQRRDPLVLEHLKVRLTQHITATQTLASTLLTRSMIAGPVTRESVFEIVHQELAGAQTTVRLLSKVLFTLDVNRALTANLAHKGFATSSELADLLAIDYGLTRTEAYELGERIATEATVMALGGMTLDTKLVDKLALDVIGREIGIEPETLGKCLSVKRFVERREVPGGPAPSAVRASIDQEHRSRQQAADWLAERREHLERASDTLKGEVEAILA